MRGNNDRTESVRLASSGNTFFIFRTGSIRDTGNNHRSKVNDTR